jgi:hypothetical protein
MKLLLFLLLSVVFTTSCSAQSPFKKRPYLAYPARESFKLGVAPLDSVVNQWRFTAGTGYSYPDGNVQAGLGFGYQHSTYTYATSSYYVNWSISGYAWAGGNVAPKTVSDVVKLSIMGGFLNGAFSIGPYYSIGPQQVDANGKNISKVGVMVITSINFNP